MNATFINIVEQYSIFPYLAFKYQGWDTSRQKEMFLSEMDDKKFFAFERYLKYTVRDNLKYESKQLQTHCYLPLNEIEQNLQILLIRKLYQINIEDKRRQAMQQNRKKYQ